MSRRLLNLGLRYLESLGHTKTNVQMLEVGINEHADPLPNRSSKGYPSLPRRVGCASPSHIAKVSYSIQYYSLET